MPAEYKSCRHWTPQRAARRAKRECERGPMTWQTVIDYIKGDTQTAEQQRYNEAERRREEKAKHDR